MSDIGHRTLAVREEREHCTGRKKEEEEQEKVPSDGYLRREGELEVERRTAPRFAVAETLVRRFHPTHSA